MLPPILRSVERAGHVIFVDGAFNLNLVGIRSLNRQANKFDDLLTATYRDASAAWQTHYWPCTLEPGAFWLEHPAKVEGTAILADGQHRSAFCIGIHKPNTPNAYRCLVQHRPVRVWRDATKDLTLDWPANDQGKPGWYSIQIHRAHYSKVVSDVGPWSGGCPVVQVPEHFAELMSLVDIARPQWGDAFTLTIMSEDKF